MKVVIVWSSPNENGLTASAKESFLSGLKKAGTEYEEVHLNKFKTEHMKAFIDRLRRCETGHNGFLAQKRCILIACAGGTGLGAVECLYNMEEALKHMGMRAYDRIPVIRYNRDYMLPALEQAGEVYVERLKDGFDMRY